jgi:hypothetical protein
LPAAHKKELINLVLPKMIYAHDLEPNVALDNFVRKVKK